MLKPESIIDKISNKFGENAVLESNLEVLQPFIVVPAEYLNPICKFLQTDPELYFDFLQSITSLDLGTGESPFWCVYHLYSIPFAHALVIKCNAIKPENGNDSEESLPVLPTISDIWKTADWHEREAYDLMGILFSDHPDMRRILLPEDWKDHPLRKDYKTEESYHGIKIDY